MTLRCRGAISIEELQVGRHCPGFSGAQQPRRPGWSGPELFLQVPRIALRNSFGYWFF
jgi:hypothetical protein